MNIFIRSRLMAIGAASVTTLLTACSSITGLDGSSSYACKAPDGIKCDSVSGTYHNAMQNNLPSQRRTNSTGKPADQQVTHADSGTPARVGDGTASLVPTSSATASAPPTRFAAAPLRSQPRILRLWIKPWEDADRDLNGESVVFVQVDNGHWLVDHAQRKAREPYTPVKATRKPNTASAPAVDPTAQTRDDAAALAQAIRDRKVPPPASN